MNIMLMGDCDKVDLALVLALLLQTHRGAPASTVITDRPRHYRYLQDEVSGVRIQLSGAGSAEGITLYDWHAIELPDVRLDKLYVVSSYDRAALEMAQQAVRAHADIVSGLIVQESECSISSRYIAAHLPVQPVFSYYDSPRRRIDWVFDGRIALKGLEGDFAAAAGSLLQDIAAIPPRELKKLWTYAKKRGA